MAKAVFRPGEMTIIPETVMIETPAPRFAAFAEVFSSSPPGDDDLELEPEREIFLGPTADDLRREAEEFRAQWEYEREAMVESANTDAERVMAEANAAAEGERLRAADEAEAVLLAARTEAEAILAEARSAAAELEAAGQAAAESARREGEEQGRAAGHEEGFAGGMAEVERLVERTRTVLERAQDKRAEILSDTEREIIDLVLLMTRKVVKVISESHREVVISNVVQALRKVKDRGNVIIRVNLADLKLATANTQNFIKMLEGVKSIQVAEDSSVDPGGCVIETDFGEIDARIASQLAELETRILQISPIKSQGKAR